MWDLSPSPHVFRSHSHLKNLDVIISSFSLLRGAPRPRIISSTCSLTLTRAPCTARQQSDTDQIDVAFYEWSLLCAVSCRLHPMPRRSHGGPAPFGMGPGIVKVKKHTHWSKHHEHSIWSLIWWKGREDRKGLLFCFVMLYPSIAATAIDHGPPSSASGAPCLAEPPAGPQTAAPRGEGKAEA